MERWASRFFSTAFLAAALHRLLGTRIMLIATAGGLGALRLALQVWSGDPLVDFVLASGAVILFVLFLPAYLGYVRGRREASHSFALALLLGLSVYLTLHGAYVTYDLSWDGRIATFLVVAVLAVLQWTFLWGLLARTGSAASNRDGGNPNEDSWSQVLPWLGIGPFFFLQLLVFQGLARLVTLTEWSFPLAYAWILFSHALGVAAGLWTSKRGRRTGLPLALIAGAVLVAVLATPPGGGVSSAVLLLVGQVAAAVLLVIVVVGQEGSNTSPGMARTTVVHGLGMVLFVGLVFGYYAVYDLDLPYGNAWLPPLAGVLLGVCGLASAPLLPRERSRLQVSWLPAQLSLLLVVVSLVWSLTWESPEPVAGTGYPVRIMTYNLHNGFDTDGNLDMEAIARVIEDQRPDIVGLQEVSRGWVVSGSLDMLTWLSHRLEMPYVFGPATGLLWGNAILSRYPILESGNVKLPPEDLLFQRGFLWARVDLGGGREVQLIDTHLHHIGEDAAVRAQQVQVILDFWKGRDHTVIMGDFNSRRYHPETELLRESGLADVLDLAHIEPGFTVSSDAQRYRIDYIFLSPGLTAMDVTIPSSTASDHLPVVATIESEP